MKKEQYLKDVLEPKHIKQMLKFAGITVVVAPTGTGKSTLIIEDIIKPLFLNQNHAFGQEKKYQEISSKSVGLFMNRTAVKVKSKADMQQAKQEMELMKAEGVNIDSYQKLSAIDQIHALDEAEIIINDEAHYFISDAWNNITNGVLNKLFTMAETKPVIMFTATPELLIEALRTYAVPYNIYDFTDVLGFHNRMSFIATDKDLEQIVKDIPAGEKWLAFEFDEKSKALMHNRAERMKDAGIDVTVYHSQWEQEADGTFKHRTNKAMVQKIQWLVGLKKFETTGAIANKALDNGIDIIDSQFKHIILINQYDHVQIKQMIGRKRFDINDESDKLTVWFTTDGNDQLEKKDKKLFKRRNVYNRFRLHQEIQMPFISAMYNNPAITQGMTEQQIKQTVCDTVFASFKNSENNAEAIEETKLTMELMQNEVYGHLLKAQAAYIEPLTRHVQIEREIDGKIELVLKPNVVKNYSILAHKLFGKYASIQWRNKDIAAIQKHVEFKNRFENELPTYLESLQNSVLYESMKQDFEAQISFYYGAQKRSDRYASRGTINKFIAKLGYVVNAKRATIDKKQQTVWVIEQI